MISAYGLLLTRLRRKPRSPDHGGMRVSSEALAKEDWSFGGFRPTAGATGSCPWGSTGIRRSLRVCGSICLRFSLSADSQQARLIHVGADSEPGQDKIVANRVIRRQAFEGLRDLQGRPEVGLFSFREPQHEADSVHVRIQRDDELGRRDSPPPAGIDLILPDHPSQEEVQPLACTASCRGRQKPAPAAGAIFVEKPDKSGEGRKDGFMAVFISGHEAPVKGAVFPDHASCRPQE
jgi:hypothetical protein